MTKSTLLEQLKSAGRFTAAQAALWHDSAELLAVADAIGREGSSVVVKIDGARKDGSIYTVVVSGGRLGEDFFRKDGADLATVLQDAISFYQSKVWAAK